MTTRLSRLCHNERLDPSVWADTVRLQAIHQLPKSGKIRRAVGRGIQATSKQRVIVMQIGTLPMSLCLFDSAS